MDPRNKLFLDTVMQQWAVTLESGYATSTTMLGVHPSIDEMSEIIGDLQPWLTNIVIFGLPADLIRFFTLALRAEDWDTESAFKSLLFSPFSEETRQSITKLCATPNQAVVH